MTYCILVCNHTKQTSKLEQDVYSSLQLVHSRLEALARYYMLQGDDVTLVYYHMKYQEGFRSSLTGNLQPCSPQG